MYRLGYACQCLGLGVSGSHIVTLTNFNKLDETNKYYKMQSLMETNLHELGLILKYNCQNDIKIFRITSKLCPMSNIRPDLFDRLIEEQRETLNDIAMFIKNNDMRVSFHPDQFVLINSPDESIFIKAVRDLRVHSILSNKLGLMHNQPASIVLHVGGAYGDTSSAIRRFKERWGMLEPNIQNKIMLENDDKSFHPQDVLGLCNDISRPMVLDVHHAWCVLYDPFKYIDGTGNLSYDFIKEDTLNNVYATWKGYTPKMHFSTRRSLLKFRSHSDFIIANDFKNFTDRLHFDCDIMLESKMKDYSLFKLKNDISESKK